MLRDVAKYWPAFKKWRYEEDAYKYLAKKIGDRNTSVFVDDEATNDEENFSGFSFKPDSVEVMKFSS